MKQKQKQKEAGRKAALTLRLNRLAKTNIDQVRALCQEIRQKEFDIDDDFSREAIIAREVQPTTWESFVRFGDRKRSSPTFTVFWIRNKSMTLDQQAYWITESYRMEVSPEELAEFMMEHERGKSWYRPYQELEDLYRLFKEITGFTYNRSFVKNHILSLQDVADLDF